MIFFLHRRQSGLAEKLLGKIAVEKDKELDEKILIETDKKLGWLPESKKVNLSLNAGDLSRRCDIDSEVK